MDYSTFQLDPIYITEYKTEKILETHFRDPAAFYNTFHTFKTALRTLSSKAQLGGILVCRFTSKDMLSSGNPFWRAYTGTKSQGANFLRRYIYGGCSVFCHLILRITRGARTSRQP